MPSILRTGARALGQRGQGSSRPLPTHNPQPALAALPAFAQPPGSPSTRGCWAMALGVQLHTHVKGLLWKQPSPGAAGVWTAPLFPPTWPGSRGWWGAPRPRPRRTPQSCRRSGCPPLQGQPGPTHLLHSQAVGASTAYPPAPAPGSSGKPGPRCLTG